MKTRWHFMTDAALVLDGATPLGPSLLPGPSDAAWIAQFGARRLAAHLKDGHVPRAALKHALADAEKSFAGLARAPIRERWQTPCAALMMAVDLGHALSPPRAHGTLVGRRIEFLWFGDCAAIVEQDGQVGMIGETLEKRKAEAARARLIAREKNYRPPWASTGPRSSLCCGLRATASIPGATGCLRRMCAPPAMSATAS